MGSYRNRKDIAEAEGKKKKKLSRKIREEISQVTLCPKIHLGFAFKSAKKSWIQWVYARNFGSWETVTILSILVLFLLL